MSNQGQGLSTTFCPRSHIFHQFQTFLSNPTGAIEAKFGPIATLYCDVPTEKVIFKGE